jgi:hypothetical protein
VVAAAGCFVFALLRNAQVAPARSIPAHGRAALYPFRMELQQSQNFNKHDFSRFSRVVGAC